MGPMSINKNMDGFLLIWYQYLYQNYFRLINITFDLPSQKGSNGGKWGENSLGYVLDVLAFLIICYGICGVLIIPKWLINDS